MDACILNVLKEMSLGLLFILLAVCVLIASPVIILAFAIRNCITA